VEIPSAVIISGIFFLTLVVAVMAKLLHLKATEFHEMSTTV
jgi:hypothetical protein